MVDQIQLPPVQAFSGGADFSQLANLGNVYQAAQEKARQQAALASLGNDPVANAQALIKSGDPSLAAMGMRLQQQAIENARSGSYLDIAKAQAQRQQDEADRIEEARKASALSLRKITGRWCSTARRTATNGATSIPGAIAWTDSHAIRHNAAWHTDRQRCQLRKRHRLIRQIWMQE